jgi:hypothetical protein
MKLRQQCAVKLLLGVAFLASLMPSLVSDVNAVSAYDNEYQTTSTISLSNTASGSMGACSSVDYSSKWPLLFDQASNTNSSQQTTIDNLKSSFETAEASGRWGVSGFGDTTYSGITLYWTEDTSLSLNWMSGGNVRAGGNDVKTISFVTQALWMGNSNCAPWARFSLDSFPPDVSSENGYTKNFFVYTDHPNYPAEYGGVLLQDVSTDVDDDGLIKAQEMTQGTSDVDMDGDTDNDGINDLKESVWYPDRNTVFCGSSECAYPDPVKKDLYVEVDWMKESGLFGRSFKPSATQLSMVQEAYNAHGINTHFDTGQYGGGNQLPSYVSNLSFTVDSSGADFYDYKNGTSTLAANFNSNRQHIWHYMVSGYEWNDGDSSTHYDEGSSGATYISDDDTFVSAGLIEDNPNNDFTYSSVNNAMAGTILHELGHSLCLNNQLSYSLRSECYYQYIDVNSAPSSYSSVMNYSYQMSDLLDYSDGANSPANSDHDDWNAVGLGFADFASVNRGDELGHGKGKFIVGINRKQAKQLRNEHRISSHVDKTKRSSERQIFDVRKNVETK